jgi:hypothetical protein
MNRCIEPCEISIWYKFADWKPTLLIVFLLEALLPLQLMSNSTMVPGNKRLHSLGFQRQFSCLQMQKWRVKTTLQKYGAVSWASLS